MYCRLEVRVWWLSNFDVKFAEMAMKGSFMGLAKHHVEFAARRHVGCIFWPYIFVIFTLGLGTFEHMSIDTGIR